MHVGDLRHCRADACGITTLLANFIRRKTDLLHKSQLCLRLMGIEIKCLFIVMHPEKGECRQKIRKPDHHGDHKYPVLNETAPCGAGSIPCRQISPLFQPV